MTDFFLSIVFIAFSLYLPGYLIARFFFASKAISFGVAPLFSFALFVVLGLGFSLFCTSAKWWMIVLAAVSIAMASFLCRKKSLGPTELPIDERVNPITVLPYVIVGFFVSNVFFVGSLDGLSSFAQLFDNASHLNGIKAMADGGNYAITSYSLFTLDDMQSGISSYIEPSYYYPAGWHLITALACSALGTSAALAENASLFVMVGVVFPVSMWVLLTRLFEGNSRMIVCGSVCVLASSAFPWYFLTFGPLYSNLAAFAVVPAAMFVTIELFGKCANRDRNLRFIVAFLITGISLASLQPNAIFSVIVLAAPVCISVLFQTSLKAGRSKKEAFIAAVIPVVAIGIVWFLLWRLPAFSSTVDYPWGAFAGKRQALFDIATLSLRSGVPQYCLCALVSIGIVYSLAKKNNRALVVSFMGCCAMYFICATSEGALRSLIDGFWYNDAYRIAALVALAGVPLAAMGLYAVSELLDRLFSLLFSKDLDGRVLFAMVSLLAAVLVYSPGGVIARNINYYTPFEDVSNRLCWLGSSDTRRYSVDEEEFVCRALELIDDDGKGIANVPYDGSVFAYGANGAKTVYRSYFSYGGKDEKPESALLRSSLSEIAHDDNVKEAARLMNVGYVLKLDNGGFRAEGSTLDDDQARKAESEFQGINSINDDTPGFDLVLSEGDMKLYRIVS